MSHLHELNQDWQDWIKRNLEKGVSVKTVATELFTQGWPHAAYQLMALHQQKPPAPFINLTVNQLQLSDRLVNITSTTITPFIVIIDDFLSEEECQALISTAEPHLKPSTVVHPEGKGSILNPVRTSHGAKFARGHSQINQTIEKRMAELLHWPVERSEGINVLKYAEGGEYKPHHDYFDPAVKGRAELIKDSGQRVGTFIMYLSDVESGGGTSFPKAKIEVRPKMGRALYFSNTKLNGDLDPLTYHAGVPVQKGTKYLATIWLRERPFA